MAIADFLARLRAAPSPPPAGAPASRAALPTTLSTAEANDALRALDVERAELRDAIAEVTARRRAALVHDASDDEIRSLDVALDRLHLRNERLDAAEPVLISAVSDARLAGQRDTLRDLVDAYDTSLRSFWQAMRAATQIRAGLVRLREHAVGCGLDRHLGSLELPVNMPLEQARIDKFEVGALQSLRHAIVATPAPATFPVTFTAGFGPYNHGERAGFPRDVAAKLVAHGVARWSAGVRLPGVSPELVVDAGAPSSVPLAHDDDVAATEAAFCGYSDPPADDEPPIAAEAEAKPKRRPKRADATNEEDAT